MRFILRSMIAVIAMTMTFAVQAGERALVEVIGYSEDGRYFAFEEYGVQDGSGFAYSHVFVIDVIEDRWVIGTPVDIQADDEETSLYEVRMTARAEAQARLDSLDVHWPADVLAYIGAGTFDTDGSRLDFGLPGIGSLADPTDRQTLEIDYFEAASAAPCMEWFDAPAMGYSLRLIAGGSDVEVHRDGIVPRSRGCPVAYKITGVYMPWEAMDLKRAVALISVYPHGFEGPDRRFIVVPIGNHL